MPWPARKPDFTNAPPVNRLTVPSPVGPLTVFEQDNCITGLVWAAGKRMRSAKPNEILNAARDQLAAYFKGQLKNFNLPLAPDGSPFERKVWKGLDRIPFGTTLTYGGLAAKTKTGARAIGRACGANPIPIIIPCHRVIGADGAMHGYSGKGGLETKAFLLRLEGALETS